MTRLHDVTDETKPTAYLVGVPTQHVSEAENQASLDELKRLVTTLGYDVIGRTSQRRSGTGSAFVLGEGKIAQLAKLTGGPGLQNAGPAIPNASNPRKKRVWEKAAEKEAEVAESVARWEAKFGQDDAENYEDAVTIGDDGEPIEGGGGVQPEAVIFDLELSPSQLRNLERLLGCEVMDRTGVIIAIFSRHARTRAAKLQVEIARLTYLAPRLRETTGESGRQGSTRGASETAVELDKRRIRDRIKELKQEFSSIDSEHDTRRSRRSELNTVALVGYTNAGKSSMMRAMTGSEVYIADKLFATLDTTVRPLDPPVIPQILLSDTVGFIKKLPHDLIASFKSTLDEALNASLLLYVVDASDPFFRSQFETVKTVLKEVGVSEETPTMMVLNKSDKLTPEEKFAFSREFPDAIIMSTKEADDIAALREKFILFFEGAMKDEELFIPYGNQSPISEIRSLLKVLSESYDNGGVRLTVRGSTAALQRLKMRYKLGEYFEDDGFPR